MSLHPTFDAGVPTETVAVAHAAFPRGHAYLSLRDALGPIYADAQFAALFARDGQPAACPWRLALVTLLQFAKNLSDSRAAYAVRAHIDWKYLLGLALIDPGFDASVLSELRSPLVVGAAEALLFDTLLDLCRGRCLRSGRTLRQEARHHLDRLQSHLTETCDNVGPPLIIHVATTPAPVVDRGVLDPLHAALAAKDLLPARHLVDAAYIDAVGLVAAARSHGVELIGPVPKDNQWQARNEGAFTIEAFQLDWDRQVAVCPAGHSSRSWCPDHNLGRTVMRIRFATRGCKACPLKPRCTRSKRRLLTPRSREKYEALVAARARRASRRSRPTGGGEPAWRARSRVVCGRWAYAAAAIST